MSESSNQPDTEPDTGSDPALSDQEETESDWASEGGALPEGPATDPEDGS